ncbi:MFS transporter [Streptosporangium carneum]|uniref:MFS transporter n=1 Tax=Streptosporangium carneum TaxID=47481 RepID=UPI0022F2C873|nr:MFS transporter [Streptosporangium carneum]
MGETVRAAERRRVVRPPLAALLPEPGVVTALTWATACRTVGRGLFVTVSVIYFTSSVGMSAVEVGLGLTIASAAGLLGGLPAGRLSDLFGPRGVTVAFSAAGAVLTCGYVVVDGFAGFVLVAGLATFTEAAEQTARSALIGVAVPPDRRVKARAYLRAVTNVGWSVGGLGAAVALHYDTRPVYLTMIFGCSACYLAGAVLTLRVPAARTPSRTGDGPVRAVLRDRPYALLALLNGVLSVHGGLLTVSIPIWVVERTAAPTATVGVMLMLNTVAVTLLQVRFSRGTENVAGAARAQRRSGLVLLVSCLLFAASAGRSEWVAVAVLAAGALAHVVGELLQAAGSWGLSYELAPAYALGQYQGFYGMGYQLANILAPALLTAAVIGWGEAGWVLFGVVFALAGLAVPPVARAAARTVTVG